MTHEYAFDVKLQAVVRVTAQSEVEARKALEGLQTLDIDLADDHYHITQASVDDCAPCLFEVDGQETA